MTDMLRLKELLKCTHGLRQEVMILECTSGAVVSSPAHDIYQCNLRIADHALLTVELILDSEIHQND